MAAALAVLSGVVVALILRVPDAPPTLWICEHVPWQMQPYCRSPSRERGGDPDESLEVFGGEWGGDGYPDVFLAQRSESWIVRRLRRLADDDYPGGRLLGWYRVVERGEPSAGERWCRLELDPSAAPVGWDAETETIHGR